MFDYDAKRLEAYKYMRDHVPVEHELRLPTSAWAGLSLSKSSPMPSAANNLSQWAHRNEASPYKLGTTTSILDATPVHDRHQITQLKEMTALLVHLKLDHYIGERT